MKMVLIAVLIATGNGPHAQDHGSRRSLSGKAEPARETAVPLPAPAALTFNWVDGVTYQAVTEPGVVTDIALQVGENLVSVAAGDTVRWVIGDTSSGTGDSRQTHLLVKPVGLGQSTNLVIATDRRVYHMRLTSSSRGAMTALSWNYPQDALLALRRAATSVEVAAPIATGLEIEKLYFGYAVSGDRPDWRPLRVFDDGRQTFIEFPVTIAAGEAPPLFLMGPEGQAELVNYRMRGRFYVVDRIFEAAELRLGTRKQQIVRIARTSRRGRA